MSRPKGINQKAKWRAHFIRFAKYADRVQSVYDTLSMEIANAVVRTSYDGSEPFRFSDYPITKKKIEEVQSAFVRDLRSLIYSCTSEEWKQSNLVQDLLADKVLKFYGVKKGGKKHRVYYQSNSDALKAFQKRKDDGMGLSERLWDQSKNYKDEMEFAISSAIEKGTSAVKLSKRLSKYLVDFPSLKNDYKEKYGKAVTCNDCEYRSIRLARTEINMAYRTAEQERWKQFDFVLGYEVKLTQNGHHVSDMCDDLAGKYPKDFVFKGWHPNCLCYVVPILKTEEEFWEEKEVEPITTTPDGFKEWIEKNHDRIEAAKETGTLPYWYTDNIGYVEIPKKYVMTNPDIHRLDFRGFKNIDAHKYNESAMAGFDIVKFDDMIENVCDENRVFIKSKTISIFENRNVELSYKGVLEEHINNVFGSDFELRRDFRIEDGKKVVYHSGFVLPKEMQGNGISKKVFNLLFQQYEKMGVDRVEVQANMDVGGYCWAKYGFTAQTKYVIDIVAIATTAGKISFSYFNDICKFLQNSGEYIRMDKIAQLEKGKDILLGSNWRGFIDLHDKEQLEYFHSYLK